MIVMHVMHVAVVQIIGMIAMLYRLVTASGPVFMCMVVVYVT